MQWPWRRFEAFYDSHQKRLQVEDMKERKQMMIQALYSNSNWDGEENNSKRNDHIKLLEEQFRDFVVSLYNGSTESEQIELESNPFLSATERGLAKQGVPKEAFEELN